MTIKSHNTRVEQWAGGPSVSNSWFSPRGAHFTLFAAQLARSTRAERGERGENKVLTLSCKEIDDTKLEEVA